jgi:hypothetical protein
MDSNESQADIALQVGDPVQTPRNLGDGYGRVGVVTKVYPEGFAALSFPGGGVSCRGWRVFARRDGQTLVVPAQPSRLDPAWGNLVDKLVKVIPDFPDSLPRPPAPVAPPAFEPQRRPCPPASRPGAFNITVADED